VGAAREPADLTPDQILLTLRQHIVDSLRIPAIISPIIGLAIVILSWARGELSPWAIVLMSGAIVTSVGVAWGGKLDLHRRAVLGVIGSTVAGVAGLFWYGPYLGVGLVFVGALGLAAWLLSARGTLLTYATLVIAFPVAALGADSGWITAQLPPVTWVRVGVVAAAITGAFTLVMRRILVRHYAVLTANYDAIQALRNSEARFGGVFELAPDAMLIIDDTGRIVQANRIAEVTLGYHRDELVGLAVDELVPEAHRARHGELRAGFFAEPGPRLMAPQSRVHARRKDGTLVPVEVNLSPFLAGSHLVVAALRDISERVRVDEERARVAAHLQQTQHLEALGTLAGGIAHEFNNLLAAILANVEVAQTEIEDPTSIVGASVATIAKASQRAAELVKQILTFSRGGATITTATSLRDVIEEVAALLRASVPAGIELTVRIPDDLPRVSIDAAQIRQVLMNLGTNAWHAIDRATGRIAIDVDAVTIAADDRSLDIAPGRYVRVSVTDDGTGIDPQILPRIFEPFFTTKPVGKGTGLGLAAAHGILASHGGAIRVTTAAGRGTTFAVYLHEARASSVSVAVHAAPPGARVLVIDDEELVAVGTARLIERLGYEVAMFVRPAEAIAAVTADPRRFDLVVTDDNMPQIGGLELARAITAIRADLPVILVSGNSRYTDEELAAASVRFRLEKPYTKAMLSETLVMALRAN
jgi:PAS domain S-box-containing protein